MNKYLLFLGYAYYPRGGWGDFQGDFLTVEEAKNYGKNLIKEKVEKEYCRSGDLWAQIVDSELKKDIFVYGANEKWKKVKNKL